MHKFILAPAALIAAALASSAHALSPAAKIFVRKAGLDPASASVIQADKDGDISSIYRDKPVKNSLESLAIKGSKKGVLSFVTSREFIRSLEADFEGTVIPKTGFDRIYLTTEERDLVLRKILGGAK
jgi:hypothetical protein